MSDSIKGAKPAANGEDFLIIDANEISFVKRGRKAMADPKLIEALKAIPNGKALAIASMKLDPTSVDYKTEKARIASQIRTACAAANLKGFRILWSPQGVPQVVR